MQTLKRRFRWWHIPVILLLILTSAISGFVIWASTPAGELEPEVALALNTGETVTVSTENWIAFTPSEQTSQTGLILYPGGKVLAEAYAPLARQIAEQGYFVVIVYAPLNLAILDTDAALAVMDSYPDIDKWVVGGHSLGGAVASIFTNSHPEVVDGLILLASYPNSDLSNLEIPVVSIYGTDDGVANSDDVLGAAAELPANTEFVAIEGGNHAQFGYYGGQAGDNPATISHATQTQQTLDAILNLLSQVQS